MTSTGPLYRLHSGMLQNLPEVRESANGTSVLSPQLYIPRPHCVRGAGARGAHVLSPNLLGRWLSFGLCQGGHPRDLDGRRQRAAWRFLLAPPATPLHPGSHLRGGLFSSSSGLGSPTPPAFPPSPVSCPLPVDTIHPGEVTGQRPAQTGSEAARLRPGAWMRVRPGLWEAARRPSVCGWPALASWAFTALTVTGSDLGPPLSVNSAGTRPRTGRRNIVGACADGQMD